MLEALLSAILVAAPACAQDSVDPFEAALASARAAREDLDVRPGRWETRFTLPALEALLADPLGLPERSSEWGRGLSAAEGLAGLSALSEDLLGVPTEAPRLASAAVSTAAASALPEPLASAVGALAGAIARARPFLELSAAGLSPAERGRVSQALLGLVVHGPARRPDSQVFELAARFDQAALLQAVRGICAAVDAAAAALLRGPRDLQGFPRALVVAGSSVTLGGNSDDAYSEEELAGSAILIDLGGANRYAGAPAAAGPGQVRIVLDLGAHVVIESTGPVATGRFGIGVLHLPDPAGSKRLRGGDFSLGAGLFGAGLLVARGDGSSFESGDFSQGAAAFGVGALDAQGAGVSLSATMSGQGFGFTRGVGLLRARGPKARLECGLVHPDPRDALAAISLCQGTGYGPRAFAAGGFGLALVESDGAEVAANYFAQGSGYWHGFGGFYLKGNRSSVQSRRYGQGAGVHTALGALVLEGRGNRLLHWGVGPGFGWDWGIGSASVRGDENALYADWAAAKGDVNGHGLLRVDGSRNRIRLGELATGALKRAAPSYGVVVVSGTANAVWTARVSTPMAAGALLLPSPWGVAAFQGEAALDGRLALEGPVFRSLERERAEAARLDREWNAARLEEADGLPIRERIEAWLFRAAEGGLEGDTPREALSRLLSLSEGQATLLPGVVAPERFDEFIHLRVLIPAYGRRIAASLSQAVAAATGLRKAVLLGFFRGLPAELGHKAALASAGDPDWRVRREALAVLGSLFDRQLGEEPGRVPFLKESLALCRRTDPRAPLSPETLERFAQKRLADLLYALALLDVTAGDRVNVHLRAPDAFGPVSADTFNAFADALGSRPKECEAALSRELKDVERLSAAAADRLAQAVEEGAPDLLPVALAALGQLGRAKDAARLAAALGGDSAFVREAAAAGLARMGAAASGALSTALGSPEPMIRRQALVAAAQSTEPAVFWLLARGFDDADESVRLTAIAAPSGAQAPLHRYRKEFVPALERLAVSDPSASVRAGAAYAAAQYR